MSQPPVDRPAPTAGLRHVALFVRQFEAAERFYVAIYVLMVLVGAKLLWDAFV